MTARERAAALHRAVPSAVGHVDLPAELELARQYGRRGVLSSYVPRLQAAGIRALIGAIFVHPQYLPEMALSSALGQTAALLAELEECRDFALVRTAGELDAALDAGRIAVVLSMEGAEPLARSPELLRPFHALGLRLLGLTWNHRNHAADGCALSGGLTPAGRALAEAAWDLGLILDVSHLSDAGFWELLSLGDGPVLASHSNCRALCAHPRNLTDAQLIQLGRRGGVIGVNQVRFLVREGPCGLADLADHLLHIEAVSGPGHAALGLDLARDYTQALPKPRAFWETWDLAAEDLLPDYDALPALTACLLERGAGQDTVTGILGGSLLSFLRRHLPP
ncbi:MAG: membrane dipeptidase [Oscillospiraceae bacterium]|nr:membrane dipeptidase [Oscillospiraceae bacterium]